MLYDAGTKDLPLGTVLAVLVEEEDDVGAFKDFKAESSESAGPPTPVKAEPTPAATQSDHT